MSAEIPYLGTTLPPESEMVQYFGPIDDAAREVTVNFAGHPVTVNQVIAGNIEQAGNAIVAAGLGSEVQNVGGYRTAIGASGAPIPYSMHNFGAAIDINEATQNWHTMSMDPRIVTIMQQYGFYWGGNWTGASADYGHFQFEGGSATSASGDATPVSSSLGSGIGCVPFIYLVYILWGFLCRVASTRAGRGARAMRRKDGKSLCAESDVSANEDSIS